MFKHRASSYVEAVEPFFFLGGGGAGALEFLKMKNIFCENKQEEKNKTVKRKGKLVVF